MLDINQVREDTPGCQNKLFFNSAGASLMPAVVLEKAKAYLDETADVGGYYLLEKKYQEIRSFYTEAARMINCSPDQIAFSNSATHGYARALSSIPFKEGDVIVTSDDDYVSNHIGFLSLQKRFGIKVCRTENTPEGDLDLNSLEELVKKHRPRLVALTQVPTNSGLVQDVVGAGNICRQYDCLYLLDACQSTGQLPVDVQEIGCDFLSTTGRKFLRGPRGTGFLYVSQKVLDSDMEPLFMDGHSARWLTADKYEAHNDASRYELFETPVALQLGLKEAIKYINDLGIENIQAYNQEIGQYMRDQLSGINGVTLYDRGSQLCNIITFRKEGIRLDDLKKKLEFHDVYFSVGIKQHAVIDYQKKGIDWLIRFSPHFFNTKEEIDKAAQIIEDI